MSSDIESKLAAVRQMVTNARSMPMSTSAVVNRGELLALIDDLEQTAASERTLAAKPHDEAASILDEARQEQQQMVTETDVYKVAVAQAEEITDNARKEANELRAESDAYVESKLANFELTLQRTLEAVQRGRSKLNGGQSAALGDDSDVAGIQLPEHLRRGRQGQ